jgi:L-threonylcarbamoyladenylate synthase
MVVTTQDPKDIIPLLKDGKVGILPTDTIYGLVAPARKKASVDRVFTLKKRDSGKPLIILIASRADLKKFAIKLNKKQEESLRELMKKNGPTSIILPCPSAKFKYLHRGKKSLAFRIPRDKELLSIIRASGPLVAPSANFEGEVPAQNIDMAKLYFGNSVDFYFDKGQRQSKASVIIRLNEDGSKEFVRQS